MTDFISRTRLFGFAIAAAGVMAAGGAAGAQARASGGPWTGTIQTTVSNSEPGYSFESSMNCELKVSSAWCTYKSVMKMTGKDSVVITESATQDHLQVGVVKSGGEWKLNVAAFMSRGTKTVTANGQTRSGNDVNIQAPNWEVPLGEVRDPNRTRGTWQNGSGGTIQWELSR